MTSNVEQDLEALNDRFFREAYVIPFLPNAPELSVLVAGLRSPAKGILLATDKTARSRVSALRRDWSRGSIPATQLLSAYYCPMEVDSAALLAFYVMMRVKDTIMGCGQDTQVIILRNGKATILPRELVRDCEHKFVNYAALQKEALFSLIGVRPDTAHAKGFLDALRGDFDTARQAIKLITSPISPNVIGDASSHSGSDAKSLVDTGRNCNAYSGSPAKRT